MEAFNWTKLYDEIRVMIYEDYLDPVSQAMLVLTCKEYFDEYGIDHLLLSNSQRGLPNDEIIRLCASFKYWDLLRWLVEEMKFPNEDDPDFYVLIVKSNRLDLI